MLYFYISSWICLAVVLMTAASGAGLDVVGPSKIRNISGMRELSKGKPAMQIDRFQFGYASKAVDGKANPDWMKGSCTHTQASAKKGEKNWWSVDLLGVYPVRSVALLNRGDACGKRLSNFDIVVTNTTPKKGTQLRYRREEVCAHRNGSVAGGAWETFYCRGGFKRGRYVAVVKSRKSPLTLCEVRVFGGENVPPLKCKPGEEMEWTNTNSKPVPHIIPHTILDNIASQEQCQELCQNDKKGCIAFEYNKGVGVCTLSTSKWRRQVPEYVRGEWKCVYRGIAREFCRLVKTNVMDKTKKYVTVHRVKSNSTESCKRHCSDDSCKDLVYENNTCVWVSALAPISNGFYVNRCYKTFWLEEESSHQLSMDERDGDYVLTGRNIKGVVMRSADMRKMSSVRDPSTKSADIRKRNRTSSVRPRFTPGIIGNGLLLTNQEFLLLNEANETCFGNKALCSAGVTFSFWLHSMMPAAPSYDTHQLFSSSYLTVNTGRYGHYYIVHVNNGSIGQNRLSVLQCHFEGIHSFTGRRRKQKPQWHHFSISLDSTFSKVAMMIDGLQLPKYHCKKIITRDVRKARGRGLLSQRRARPTFSKRGEARLEGARNFDSLLYGRRSRPTNLIALDEFLFWNKNLPNKKLLSMYNYRKTIKKGSG